MGNAYGSPGLGGTWNTHAHGSARWMTPAEAAELDFYNSNAPGGILLGQNSRGQFCSLNIQGHVIVLAPPRTGKGVGFVQANLVSYRGSMVVTDPKGENAAVTAKFRREALGQNVVVLDPTGKLKSFGLAEVIGTQRFNPLTTFDNPNYGEVVDDIGLVADALLVPKDGEREQHWRDGARMFLTGLLTYLVFFVDGQERNLITLSRVASGLEGSLDDIFAALTHNDHPDPVMRDVIAKSGAWWDKVNVKERSSFVSLALRSLAWLNSPVWHDHLKRSDFHPYDLKHGDTTVYIVCPFEKLEQYSPWFRLVLSCCIVAILRVPNKGGVPPTLFMLDEYAAAIGRLAMIEQSMAYIEGAGGRYAIIFQYLSQMQKLWPEPEYHGIFASAGAHLFFNVNDQNTSEYVSKYIGKYGAPLPSAGGVSNVQRELLTPDEVRTLPPSDLIAFIRGYRPAWIGKLDARSHPGFRGRLAPNPLYGAAPTAHSLPPRAATSGAPLLSAARALDRAKTAPLIDLDVVAGAIAEKYPDKDVQMEGDMLGYYEQTRDPSTGRTETVFVPIMHVSLLEVLKG